METVQQAKIRLAEECRKSIVVIRSAIADEKKISFKYPSLGKNVALREVAVYSLHWHLDKSKALSLKIDGVQTGGFSSNPLTLGQLIKLFDVRKMTNLMLLTEHIGRMHDDFEPSAARYQDSISIINI